MSEARQSYIVEVRDEFNNADYDRYKRWFTINSPVSLQSKDIADIVFEKVAQPLNQGARLRSFEDYRERHLKSQAAGYKTVWPELSSFVQACRVGERYRQVRYNAFISTPEEVGKMGIMNRPPAKRDVITYRPTLHNDICDAAGEAAWHLDIFETYFAVDKNYFMQDVLTHRNLFKLGDPARIEADIENYVRVSLERTSRKFGQSTDTLLGTPEEREATARREVHGRFGLIRAFTRVFSDDDLERMAVFIARVEPERPVSLMHCVQHTESVYVPGTIPPCDMRAGGIARQQFS